MSTRRNTTRLPLPGIPARAESDCQRCGLTIHRGERIVFRRGWAIHAESASVWPACTWHAHRYGGALTLAQIAEAHRTGATRFQREVESC